MCQNWHSICDGESACVCVCVKGVCLWACVVVVVVSFRVMSKEFRAPLWTLPAHAHRREKGGNNHVPDLIAANLRRSPHKCTI